MCSVLVVEDDEAIRRALIMLIELWGHSASGAATVSEALGVVDRSLPDLLLVDYRLRNSETGLMVVDAVRRRAGSAVPALMLTGDTAPERLKDLAAKGIPVLHKPVVPYQIRSMVSAHCRRAGCNAARAAAVS